MVLIPILSAKIIAFCISSIAFSLVFSSMLPIGNLLCPLKHIDGILIPVFTSSACILLISSSDQSSLASLSSVSSTDISTKSYPHSFTRRILSIQSISLGRAFSYIPKLSLFKSFIINLFY